jgi:hypothetical protein
MALSNKAVKHRKRGDGGIRERPSPSSRQRKSSTGDGSTSLTVEELRRLIERAAYRRAERRGFVAGGELEDWLAAEREVLESLGIGPRRERPLEASDTAAALRQGVVLEVPPADDTAR